MGKIIHKPLLLCGRLLQLGNLRLYRFRHLVKAVRHGGHLVPPFFRKPAVKVPGSHLPGRLRNLLQRMEQAVQQRYQAKGEQ